jgi:glycosyltransferase involved in cell wall biosynthesis
MEVPRSIKRFYRQSVVNGHLQPLGRVVFDMVIAGQLAAERALDTLHPMSQSDPALLEELTLLIKTFQRPRVLRRLVGSIRRFYPTLRITVVDDSRNPSPIAGVQTITMPYDSGVSAGRNEGLRHVTTRYVMVLDDDFVFYRHTNLGAALAIIEQYPRIDIMGGEVVNLPLYKVTHCSHDGPFSTRVAPVLPHGTLIGDLPVQFKVPNLFIARADRLRLVPWDPALKLIEHNDFFTQAMGVLVTVYNSRLKCLHARTPFDVEYTKKRSDTALDGAILNYKYHFRRK